MPRFRVLQGIHSEGGKIYAPKSAVSGLDIPKEKYGGEVVVTKSDLTRFNSPGAVKFEKLPEKRGDG